jgi:hypothetical protein
VTYGALDAGVGGVGAGTSTTLAASADMWSRRVGQRGAAAPFTSSSIGLVRSFANFGANVLDASLLTVRHVRRIEHSSDFVTSVRVPRGSVDVVDGVWTTWCLVTTDMASFVAVYLKSLRHTYLECTRRP